MELIKAKIPFADFQVYDLSDFHVGSPNCAEETLEEVIQKISSEENSYIIFKGDAIEAILPNDKRYMHSAVKETLQSPKQQADKVIEMFKPVKEKVLAWGIGNHELKLWNTIDFGKYIADALEAPYGAYTFKISFVDYDNKLMFKTFHTHGMGSINSSSKDSIQYEASRKATLRHKLSKSGHSDVIYMSRGHDHQLIVVEPTIQNHLFLTDDGKSIHQHYQERSNQQASYIPPDSRWYATTGSFRKLYAASGSFAIDYGEVAGYSPSEIGYAKLIIKDKCLVDVQKIVA